MSSKVKLPNPDAAKAAREAREAAEALASEYEALTVKEAELIREYEAQDQAGASIEELQALEKELATVERRIELKERTLAAADREAGQARELAEEGTKKAAAAEGKKIASRILAAAEELDRAQADYADLSTELKKLVNFRNPNAENYQTYCGPSPAYFFNSMDQRFESYKDHAQDFTGARKKAHKPDDRPQLAQQAGLYLS